jgi:hypothetical protein
MKTPIRMMTLATSFLWILLMVASASIIYSTMDIRLDIGKPQISLTSENELSVEFQIGIINSGFYNLDDFNISTKIRDPQNTVAAQGSIYIPSIKKGETLNTTLQMRTNLTWMLQANQDLITKDAELRINADISAKTAGLFTLRVSSNLTMPWGAPLYDLTFASPRFTLQTYSNSTNYYRIVIPVAFENHAFFDLDGSAKLDIYNNRNVLTGTGAVVFKTPQQSSFKADLQLDAPAASFSSGGHFEVYFSTSLFNYGPLVIPYGE